MPMPTAITNSSTHVPTPTDAQAMRRPALAPRAQALRTASIRNRSLCETNAPSAAIRSCIRRSGSR